MPPAPGRGSITTCTPQRSVSLAPTTRAIVSGDPPGAPNDSTKRTGRFGKSWANAPVTKTARSRAAENPAARRRIMSTSESVADDVADRGRIAAGETHALERAGFRGEIPADHGLRDAHQRIGGRRRHAG